jgi:hypothetical protein
VPRDGGGSGPLPLPPPHPLVEPDPLEPLPVEDQEDDLFGPLAPLAPREEPAKKAEKEKWLCVDALDGCRMSWQPYMDLAGEKKTCSNYVLKCPAHAGCFKSRGVVPRFCAKYGDIEPLAYLQAWAQIPWPREGGASTHRAEKPEKLPGAIVDAYVAARKEDLEGVLAAIAK